MRTAVVFTHSHAEVVGTAAADLVRAAREHGLTLVCSAEEAERHPAFAEAAERGAGRPITEIARDADIAIVLAGDGTLIRVLHQLVDGPPVLGVNFGMLGFLSGASSDDLEDVVRRIADPAPIHSMTLPMLEADAGDGPVCVVNDIVASGGPSGGITELGWSIVHTDADGVTRQDDMGQVPCDGMVLATAVGSTAYNLSNGGPLLAWGVEGIVISFVAPHTLLARPMVLPPGHSVRLEHLGRGRPVSLFADGVPFGSLAPNSGCLTVRVAQCTTRLVLLDGRSFYARYRTHFTAGPAVGRREPLAQGQSFTGGS